MTGSVLSSSHGQVFAGLRKMARIGADKSATTVIYRSPTVSLTYTYYKTSTVILGSNYNKVATVYLTIPCATR